MFARRNGDAADSCYASPAIRIRRPAMLWAWAKCLNIENATQQHSFNFSWQQPYKAGSRIIFAGMCCSDS